MRLSRLTSSRRVTGPLFCPCCCWKLGRADSPAIGYLTQCGGCRRGLRVIDVEGGDVAVIVEEHPDDGAVFVELDR